MILIDKLLSLSDKWAKTVKSYLFRRTAGQQRARVGSRAK